MSKEILIAARNGNSSAFNELTEAYKPLIESMTDKYCRLAEGFGAEREDLHQEASLAFYRAVMSYDVSSEGVSFGLYAKICIRNRLVSLVRSYSRRARAEKKSAVENKNTDARVREHSFDMEELRTISSDLLSKKEREIFLMYAEGKSYKEISEALNISLKSVDNGLLRAMRKLRERLTGK